MRGIKAEAVGIGRLERFVADYHCLNNQEKNAETRKQWPTRLPLSVPVRQDFPVRVNLQNAAMRSPF